MSEKEAMGAFFEDELKKAYSEFVEILRTGAYDDIAFFQKLCITSLVDLLKARPEREKEILGIIVTKLGDKNKEVGQSVISNVVTLLDSHPAMGRVISAEVKGFMSRANPTGLYYSVALLNRIMHNEEDLDRVIETMKLYFGIFGRIKGDEG
jgi:ribosome biogenesis protein MAK21